MTWIMAHPILTFLLAIAALVVIEESIGNICKAIIHSKQSELKEVTEVPEFHEGELIIYQNGDRYEIGKIKRLTDTGAFVWYSEGDTAAKTPYECLHKIVNGYTIKETSLGGVQRG